MACAIALLGLLLIAASPSPKPSAVERAQPPMETSIPKARATSAERNETASPMPSIHLTAAPHGKGEANYPGQNPNPETIIAAYTEALADYTLALVIVAALQFVAMAVQAVYLGRSLYWTRISFQTTERALTRQRIPIIFIGSVSFRQVSMGPFVTPAVTYTFRNYGSTPAFIKRVCVQCTLYPTLEVGPRYPTPEVQMPDGFAVGASEERAMGEVRYMSMMDGPDVAELVQYGRFAGSRFFFYGKATYSDIFDDEYTLGFAWILDNRPGDMRIATEQEAPGYNYRPQETDPPLREWRVVVGR